MGGSRASRAERITPGGTWRPIPGVGLTAGYALTYASLMVLVQLSAVVRRTASMGSGASGGPPNAARSQVSQHRLCPVHTGDSARRSSTRGPAVVAAPGNEGMWTPRKGAL